MQPDLYTNQCKICKQFKNRKTFYECIPPKNITEIKPRDKVYVDLVGPYSNYIRHQQLGSAIIKNNVSFTRMMIIDPATGWFEIVEVPMYDLNEVTGGNDEYFENGSEFKQYFMTLLNNLDIKPV